MAKRKTHEEFLSDFYSKFDRNEYEVLGRFVKSSEPILIRHNECGIEYYARPYNLYMGKGCAKCCNKIKHSEFVKMVQKKLGPSYKVLTKYKGSKRKVIVRHDGCGETYEVTAEVLWNGHGCKKCAGTAKLTTAEVKKRIREISNGEYEFISKYKCNNKPIILRHISCEHEFETTYSLFISLGIRCPLCSGNHRLSHEEFVKKVNRLVGNEYSVLSQFKGVGRKIKMKHIVCGHEYLVTPFDFNRGRRCPKCNESKGEKLISKILDSMGVSYKRQYRFKDCRDKLPLRFDFCVFKNGKVTAAIEFNGHQHYNEIDYFKNERLKDRQRRDKIKRDYCKEKGIQLIVIPYTETDIEGKLREVLR